MTKLQLVTEVHSPVETIWSVLMDPSYIPKLYPDVLTAEVDPPGRTNVGQTFHITGRAGRRKLEIFAETIEIVERKKVGTRQRPGGLFKSFESRILLEPNGKVTNVLTSFNYELSMSYLGRVFNMVLLERLVSDNLRAYSKNLKDICELLPLPP
ncbi:MAG: SRPBCC family protein [Nitrososphaerota archaeon]|nr:SRPBCC family protein [Nitrososphaerota archaeon]